MNNRQQALLYGARLAYPLIRWKVHAESIIYTDDRTDKYGEAKQFDIHNDHDWVALREALDKKGHSLYWDKEECKYLVTLSFDNFFKEDAISYKLRRLGDENPREVAIQVCGVLAEHETLSRSKT